MLVDTDMRRPQLARMLGRRRSGDPGLSEHLAGQAALDDVIQKDEISGVHYIPAGGTPANPAVLLDSPHFGEFLEELRTRYERILFDTPPIGPTSDALHLVPHIDGILVVARAESTSKHALLAALKRLRQIQAPLLGMVLNGAVAERKGNYGYYAYRY